MKKKPGHKPERIGKRNFKVRAFVHRIFALSMWSVFSLLPVRWASAIGGAFAAHVLYHFPFTRHFRTNVDLLFPELPEKERRRIARGMARNTGRTFAEYPHLGTLTDPDQNWIETVDLEVYQRLWAEGRPIIFVTGHIANWELTAGVGGRRGIPLTVAYATRHNAPLNDRLLRYRSAMQCKLAPRDAAALQFYRALSNKECIGIIFDQRADDGIWVPFFGRPAATTPAPARLALKFDALIVPVQCERLDGARFRVTFHEALRPADFRSCPDPVAAMTENLNRTLEQWIRANPQDWMCRRRRWAT